MKNVIMIMLVFIIFNTCLQAQSDPSEEQVQATYTVLKKLTNKAIDENNALFTMIYTMVFNKIKEEYPSGSETESEVGEYFDEVKELNDLPNVGILGLGGFTHYEIDALFALKPGADFHSGILSAKIKKGIISKKSLSVQQLKNIKVFEKSHAKFGRY